MEILILWNYYIFPLGDTISLFTELSGLYFVDVPNKKKKTTTHIWEKLVLLRGKTPVPDFLLSYNPC